MEHFFRFATPAIYWALIIIWTYILVFYIRKVKTISSHDKLLKLLLIVLAIDSFRTVLESIYFGAWYTSLSELIPIEVFNYLAQPQIVFIPKVINLIAAILISTILIKKWLTSEIDQKYQLNKMVDEQTSEINTISKKNLNALKQIKASEKYYKQSIENAPYPIMIHAEGEVVQLSDAWTKITGYTINDIPTISQWTAKAYGEDAIPSKEFIDNLYTIDSVQYDGEWEVTTKSGDKRIWDFSSSPNGRLSDGRKSVTSMAVDITDQKINEDKIKKQNKELIIAKQKAEESEANISAIIEGTNNSIWAFNRNYQILYLNHVFQEEFLQTFGVLLEPGMDLIEALPESLQPFWKPRYDKVLANEQYTVEDAIPTDNSTIYIQVSFNPIVKKGQVIGGSCFGSDITLRKRVEIDLLEAKEKAEESDLLKSAFLANMSHEIRTPMNGILGFASLLKEPKLSGEVQEKYISIIEKGGVRMLNIINDIINISKIESGQMEIHKQETNINEQIEYIYTFFKPEVEGKGMQFSFKNSLPSKEAIIKTDREKVYALLTNLVKNAIKYSEKGSIEFGYEKKINFLEFYVKDTGIGIPKDRQKAIFERFIQADIFDKNAYQGAGLGLSISKAYIEMLGGKIWVVSEKGIGSTFYFTLPYLIETKDEFAINEISSPVEESSINNLKILIAEDEDISEEYITIIVRKFGKEILSVKTGKEAVEACRNNPDIDLVLMDINMPDMNGYEATRQIRKSNKDVIIIAQTAYALSGDKEKAIEAGCDDYISKPINKSELLEKIENCLGKK